jgi:hypothetical protein
VNYSRQKEQRQEVIEALVRLTVGKPLRRVEVFPGTADANRVNWQRRILKRLEDLKYIVRYGTDHLKYTYVRSETKHLEDLIDNPKALTGVIWPGHAGVFPDEAEDPVQTQPLVEPQASEEVVEAPVSTVSTETVDDQDEVIPPAQFQGAVLKLLFGIAKQQGELSKAMNELLKLNRKVFQELGVK